MALLLAGCSSGAPPAAPAAPSPAASPAASPAPQVTRPADVAAAPRPAPTRRPPALPDALQLQFTVLVDGCLTRGWTLCHELGTHYLDATGTTLDVDLDPVLARTPALVTRLRSALSARHPDTGWLPWDFTGDTDAHFAFGHAWVRTVARPTAGGWLVRTFLDDTYDFDAGAAFGSFGRLVDEGRAAEFRVHGASSTRLRSVPDPGP